MTWTKDLHVSGRSVFPVPLLLPELAVLCFCASHKLCVPLLPQQEKEENYLIQNLLK